MEEEVNQAWGKLNLMHLATCSQMSHEQLELWLWSWQRESWSHHQGKTEVRGGDELMLNEGRLLGEGCEESHLHGWGRGGTRQEGAKKGGGGREDIIRGRRESHQQWGR